MEKQFADPELVSSAKKELFERTRLLSPHDTLASVQDLKKWVTEELSFEHAASASFGRVLNDLGHAEYLDQLPPLLNKFDRLASAYYVRRGSVTAFHGFCNAWREGLLKRVLLFAEEGLEVSDHGHPPAPYALLASGCLGRREQTMEEGDAFYLVWSGAERKYFEDFSYRVLAILDQLGVISKDGLGSAAHVLWRGSFEEWERFAGFHGDVEFPTRRLEQLSDLRMIAGDETLGRDAVLKAATVLERYREGREYETLSEETLSMPVALGVLGGLLTEMNGPHRGSINLTRSAIYPLVSAVRLLALQEGLDAASTLDRLTVLKEMEVLHSVLAERVEAAYHMLAGIKVKKEIALEPAYVTPGALTAREQHELKGALEAVRQLQRQIRRILSSRKRRPVPVPGALHIDFGRRLLAPSPLTNGEVLPAEKG
ncbi:DUF294 nucleotidyltransferase-like domain-containing protein [Geomonas sp. Red32]|uniref:putative nucleotidyltransferase substrate binding domain-containing protein n=1 Tax=Geomonas sp. Red32 TaxID=2912856 RepID=UPI00202CCC41|nr:putative nucleotidyltransferase substrate binding domain-containing protein [Geomonas sp. Red32]MCM0084455.1 DUF294 nucleotidyltransferase-like domain-containing protein [Geomonas sp. Red32]